MMLPWVVLGITLAIGLLVSVIYTAVVFFIESFVLAGVLWLIFGLLSVGKYSTISTANFVRRLVIIFPILSVIYVYMWMVVYSHFMEIREEAHRGRYNKQPYRR